MACPNQQRNHRLSHPPDTYKSDIHVNPLLLAA